MNIHGFDIKNGQLQMGKFAVSELVKQYGSPLYLMDETRIRKQMRTFKTYFKDDEIKTGVCYASKAFLCKEMARVVKEEGLNIDVSSGGELYTALAAGVEPQHIEFHGNNKTNEELEYAVKSKIGLIIIDNVEELDRLESICKTESCSVLIRTNPGVEAHTHKYIQTSTLDSKFGVVLNSDLLITMIKRCMDHPNINFMGLHAHIGSQICDESSYVEELEAFFKQLKVFKETGIELNILNIGGGFGVQYTSKDEPIHLEKVLPEIIKNAKLLAQKYDVKCPSLYIEPGRSIVAEAGINVYKVGSIKKTPNKNFVIVDGSFQDSIRAALYQADYDAILCDKADQKADTKVNLMGRACESGDILIHECTLGQVEVDDLVAVFTTGAYHYSMANNYNRFTKPAVVFVKDDSHRVVVKRETYEDLVRNDL